MKIKIKKIIAREFLLILVSIIICMIAYGIGMILDSRYDIKKNEVEKYDFQIDNYLIEFRKNPKVDSIIKLQHEFFKCYWEEFYNNSPDSSNYFFWKNVRKSILDSTFNFSYAKDEITKSIVHRDNENMSQLNHILYETYKNSPRFAEDHDNGYFSSNDLDDLKIEFKYFALNNNYERYLNINDWKKYEDLRFKKRDIEIELIAEREKYSSNRPQKFAEIVFILCLTLFFFLRFLVYIILWSIKILKQ